MTPAEELLRLGILACLLGQKVCFDGGHKRDSFLVDTFGAFVEWVPVCPEVELGLGTPRESLRLVCKDAAIRMVNTRSGRDVSDEMRAYARARVEDLANERLAGCVLKKDSPSCGMERVKIYTEGGMAEKQGRGFFADALMHMLGHFKTLIDDDARHELLASIEDYRKGLVPLIVPLTLVKHHVRRCHVDYLAGQVYLDPHPKELMLRNHV